MLFKKSTRFLEKPVEPEKLRVLEESTLYAPHELNPPQPWKVVVIKSPEKVKELTFDHTIKSPVIFLFFVLRGFSKIHLITNMASGVAQALNLNVQANYMGLGCYVDVNPSKTLYERAFRISGLSREEWELSAIGFVGYPVEEKKVFFEVKERG